MEKLECVTSSLDEWRPSIEVIVDDIKLEVSKTKLEVLKISRNWEHAILDQPATSPGVFAAAPVATPKAVELPPLGAPAPTPNGRCVDNHHRESGFGGSLYPDSFPGQGYTTVSPTPISSFSITAPS
jgi:hypothetical protein